MSTALYLFRELLRSLSAKSWGMGLSAILATALVLLLLALGSRVLEPRPTPSLEGLIAVPRATLSQVELAELYRRLLADPDIAAVRFLVGQGPQGGDGTKPLGSYHLTLRRGGVPEAVIERLLSWGVFVKVEKPQPEPPGLVRAWAERPLGRWLFPVSLLAAVGFALGLLALSLRSACRSFRAERELLELSGVDPAVIRKPFALLGGLYAALGALLAASLALLGGATLPSGAKGWIAKALPELLEPGAFSQLGVRALLLGALLVGVGAGIGHLTARPHRYPSPRSRSRISSSSSGERGDSPSPSERAPEAEEPAPRLP